MARKEIDFESERRERLAAKLEDRRERIDRAQAAYPQLTQREAVQALLMREDTARNLENILREYWPVVVAAVGGFLFLTVVRR